MNEFSSSAERKSFEKLQKGAILGTDDIFNPKYSHSYSLKSTGVSQLVSISLTEFYKLIREYPNDHEKF